MRVPAGSMFIEMKHNFSFVTTCSAKRQRSYPILKIEQVYRSKTFESLVLLGKAHRIRPQTVELKWCYFNQRKSNHFCKSLFLCAFRFHFHFDYHSRFVSLQISFNAVWIYIKLIDSMTNVKLKSTLRVQFQRIFSKKKKYFPERISHDLYRVFDLVLGNSKISQSVMQKIAFKRKTKTKTNFDWFLIAGIKIKWQLY